MSLGVLLATAFMVTLAVEAVTTRSVPEAVGEANSLEAFPSASTAT
jgi:hypothetical protein